MHFKMDVKYAKKLFYEDKEELEDLQNLKDLSIWKEEGNKEFQNAIFSARFIK